MSIRRLTRLQIISLSCFFLILFSSILGALSFKTTISHVQAKETTNEFNAVWISYLEFGDRLKDPKSGTYGFTKKRFYKVIDEMFDNVASLKMNAVVVQVRPFADAMYPSDYYPWSKYISGEQGKDPGFDPLEYMVEAAHDRGLEFHAWINPFRVTSSTTDITKLSKDNVARKWLTDKDKKNDRRVLSYDGSLYFNPADQAVTFQIVNGIKELVENYDIDGIHFDDYFYPTLGNGYTKKFDHVEYKEYIAWCKEFNIKPKTIANWRRMNINNLIKEVYSAIKAIDDSVVFGISPGGFLDTLMMDDRYYCDIKTWLSKPGYIDYICPQLYWSFSHSIYPFDKTLDRWLELRTNEDVKMYVGLPTYRAGSDLEADWKKDPKVLMNMVKYARKTAQVDGFFHFRYDFFYNKTAKAGVKQLLKIL